MTNKFCRDCRYCEPVPDRIFSAMELFKIDERGNKVEITPRPILYRGALCRRVEVPRYHPVSGARMTRDRLCENERKRSWFGLCCGPDGQYWEAREDTP